MLAQELRQAIDLIWDRIWSSGISNPIDAADYMSELLLMHPQRAVADESALSSWDEVRSAATAGDLPRVHQLLACSIIPGLDEAPLIRFINSISDTTTLADVMATVDGILLSDRNVDIAGDIFEYVLRRLSTAGHFGQFRTPRHIIQFMVNLVAPRVGEVVVDPAAGTGGFLIAAAEAVCEGTLDLRGYEIDRRVAGIAQMNLRLHGQRARVSQADALAADLEVADVILANPPFAGTVSPERVAGHLTNGSIKTELLFLEWMLKSLAVGGRCAVVLPVSVLTSNASAAVWLRRQLVDMNRLRAVVELPSGVFRPYTDVRTAVLFWENAQPTGSVCFVRINADGYTLDDRREPIESNDLPGALRAIQLGEAVVPFQTVPVNAIEDERYNLSPSIYISGPIEHNTSRLTLDEAFSALQESLVTFSTALDECRSLL